MSFLNLGSLFSRTRSVSRNSSDEESAMANGENASSSNSAGNEDDEEEVFDQLMEPKPGPSREAGKSPAPSDDSISSGDIKRIKLSVESDKNGGDNSSEEEEDDFSDDMMYDSDDDDSEYYIEDIVFKQETALSSSVASLEQCENVYVVEVLTTDEIVKLMDDCIVTANSVLQLPHTLLRNLLNHYSWDKDKLCETYFAGGDADRDKIFRDADLVNPLKLQGSDCVSSTVNDGSEECEICYSPVSASEMYGMACGHNYCVSCWSHYLTTMIVDEGMGQALRCIAHNCKMLVDDNAVMNLITDPDVLLKYQHQITSSYVQCNMLLKWCPSPDCNYAVKVQHVDKNGRTVTCKCGHTFCFNCTTRCHDPICCDLLKKWLKKCEDDSETSNWLAVNTKECPKCKVSIQKNGGCNHMVCRNKGCLEEFCWVCLGPWVNHDAYRCNRYTASEEASALAQQNEARTFLERYLFYFNRYAAHRDSLKLERNLYQTVEDKMAELQNCHNMSWVEVQFLKNAVDTLCRCRQTLMYTYAFAYYVEKTTANNQIQIFESNQEDLQAAIEKLSACLEREEDISQLKQKVQDMSRYCAGRRQVLLDHVREGHEKDWWKFPG